MVDRRVRATGKDGHGDITKLCNGMTSWSPRSKTDVIADIEYGIHIYYVEEQTPRTLVTVVTRYGKKHLQTTADGSHRNNLKGLPNC
jgi:hypothetical protein